MSISNDILHDQIAKFWAIEQCETKRLCSAEEVYCEAHFVETHERTKQGRIIVKLPRKVNI